MIELSEKAGEASRPFPDVLLILCGQSLRMRQLFVIVWLGKNLFVNAASPGALAALAAVGIEDAEFNLQVQVS